MFKENPFDPVFDCQQVFKTLMNALARPGTIVSMEKTWKNWREKTRLFWPQALALLDNWRRFLRLRRPAAGKELRELTMEFPTCFQRPTTSF